MRTWDDADELGHRRIQMCEDMGGSIFGSTWDGKDTYVWGYGRIQMYNNMIECRCVRREKDADV